jgi:electron transfer flavoprotein alpha subunit
MTVLCLVEIDAGGAMDASLRTLAFARSLAATAGGSAAKQATEVAAMSDVSSASVTPSAADISSPPPVTPPSVTPLAPGGGSDLGPGHVAAILFPPSGEVGPELLAELGRYGAADAYVVATGEQYAPAAWARSLAELAVETGAAAVVAAATDQGSEVLAHLGAITGQPVAAGCVAAAWVAPGACELTRQRWAGSLLEDATLEAPLTLLTVASDAISAEPTANGAPTARPFRTEFTPADLAVRAVEAPVPEGGVSLATARVVVGGGRGVGGPDGFGALEELAALLGGTVGVSRVVTSEGWRPHRQQVGQTGTKIAPELYLACGISGAIQHLAGCQGAKTLVAVNTDPDAPIMARADYAVIGDLAQIVPALVAAIQARVMRGQPRP